MHSCVIRREGLRRRVWSVDLEDRGTRTFMVRGLDTLFHIKTRTFNGLESMRRNLRVYLIVLLLLSKFFKKYIIRETIKFV